MKIFITGIKLMNAYAIQLQPGSDDLETFVYLPKIVVINSIDNVFKGTLSPLGTVHALGDSTLLQYEIQLDDSGNSPYLGIRNNGVLVFLFRFWPVLNTPSCTLYVDLTDFRKVYTGTLSVYVYSQSTVYKYRLVAGK